MNAIADLNATHLRHALTQLLAHSAAAQCTHRLDGVLLVAQGCSCREVSHWFGVDERTVQRWVKQTRAAGLPAPTSAEKGGRPMRLSAQQQLEVAQLLRAPPSALGYSDGHWSGKRLAQHLGRVAGVELSARSCQRLIGKWRAQGRC